MLPRCLFRALPLAVVFLFFPRREEGPRLRGTDIDIELVGCCVHSRRDAQQKSCPSPPCQARFSSVATMVIGLMVVEVAGQPTKLPPAERSDVYTAAMRPA